MTDITAKIITDSVGLYAPRLTTIQLRYPRFIHAELMTHRVFSRNARSSRAVPIAKMIEEVETNPVVPLHWGKAEPGMQARAETSEFVFVDGFLHTREQAWHRARREAVRSARAFMDAGYAKQLVNRILEPFLHIDTLVTATEYENWFKLRDHGDAEPHIEMLAKAMRVAMDGSTPRRLLEGQWHLPYVTDEEVLHGDFSGYTQVQVVEEPRKISAARCARISYAPFVDSHAPADVALADKLAVSGHWSPFEHQATPDVPAGQWDDREWMNEYDHNNFVGWRQSRAMIERDMMEAGLAA